MSTASAIESEVPRFGELPKYEQAVAARLVDLGYQVTFPSPYRPIAFVQRQGGAVRVFLGAIRDTNAGVAIGLDYIGGRVKPPYDDSVDAARRIHAELGEVLAAMDAAEAETGGPPA